MPNDLVNKKFIIDEHSQILLRMLSVDCNPYIQGADDKLGQIHRTHLNQ